MAAGAAFTRVVVGHPPGLPWVKKDHAVTFNRAVLNPEVSARRARANAAAGRCRYIIAISAANAFMAGRPQRALTAPSASARATVPFATLLAEQALPRSQRALPRIQHASHGSPRGPPKIQRALPGSLCGLPGLKSALSKTQRALSELQGALPGLQRVLPEIQGALLATRYGPSEHGCGSIEERCCLLAPRSGLRDP